MYVEDVDFNNIQNDLVLGMYNYLRPMNLYQHDSTFNLIGLKPSAKTSLGMTVKFSKGKILIDSIFSNSGAFNAQLKNKDQIIGIDDNKLNEVYYYSDFYNLSLGNENSISNLTIIREKDTINIDVKRLKIPNHSIIPIPNSLNVNSINSYEKGLQLFDLIYPDTISNSVITEYGIRYMLEQLDPHSTYISLKDLHDMNAPLKGSFTGVGIRFQIFKDTVLIVQAIPGGPSEKVGFNGWR